MKKHLSIFLVILCPLFVFSQNVGIGTTTPEFKLDVESLTDARARIYSPNSSYAGFLVDNSLQQYFIGVEAGFVNSRFAIYDNTAGALRFQISTTGNVGIGNITPSAKLEVEGEIKADSLDVQSGLIKNVADPVSAQDAATKGYVDNNALPSSPSTGEIVFYNGTSWILLSPGTDGQILQLNSGIPSWTDSSCDLSIGQFYKGGYIFYLDATGCHGLVAAPADQSTSAQWGCFGILIGGTSAAVGTGQANTIAIVSGCATPGIAARLCDDLVYGGYDDWFLPSKDELNLMWINLADPDGNNNNSGPSDPNNTGGFVNYWYWSSTEIDGNLAWRQDFGYGDQFFNSKSNGFNVRAVRAF